MFLVPLQNNCLYPNNVDTLLLFPYYTFFNFGNLILGAFDSPTFFNLGNFNSTDLGNSGTYLSKIFPNSLVIASKENLLAVDDGSPQQLVDTASIPGVVGEVWGMADFHRGYGIPIGGVVSTDIKRGGAISPGGVGFDINCGVRLCSIDLDPTDLDKRIGGDVKSFGNRLKSRIPASIYTVYGNCIYCRLFSNVIFFILPKEKTG